jgi:uncharacterized RmlC-like cupin family protein
MAEAFVPSCTVVRSGESYEGRQGLTYRAGLTGATAGSRAISMVLVTLPPGARAKAHLHHGIETAIHVLEGQVETWHGERLAECAVTGPGDYLYISAEMPHLVVNRSDAPCRALVAHTAPDDQAGIVLLPELDALVR